MNGYIALYRGKQVEVYAATSYQAQCRAAEVLNVRPNKSHEISVYLCERADGSPVTHSTAAL